MKLHQQPNKPVCGFAALDLFATRQRSRDYDKSLKRLDTSMYPVEFIGQAGDQQSCSRIHIATHFVEKLGDIAEYFVPAINISSTEGISVEHQAIQSLAN